MKGYEEIKRTLVEDLGFRDLDSYKKWMTEVRPKKRPDAKSIAMLSPDEIDNRAFWRACDELFGIDPVCNVVATPEVGRLPYEIESRADANRMNLRFAKTFGITALLEENAHARLRVLEIGAGYGSMKNFIETNTNHVYLGTDVVPRVDGIVQQDADGSLPRELVEREAGKLSYVVSTNVFQHLSMKQRGRMIADARAVLHTGGLLVFNMTIDTSKVPDCARDAAGNAWSVHYGQYTPIPKGSVAFDLIADGFDILYFTQRYDGVFNFVCQRR
jgi:hypothetical protein